MADGSSHKFHYLFSGFLFLAAGQALPAASPNIIVDQFGYKPADPKIVIFAQPNTGVGSPSSFTPGATFYVINASGGATVFTGTPAAWNGGAVHSQSGDKAWQGDFSAFSTSGTYYIQVPGGSNPGASSYDFKIQNDVYNGVVTASQRMFFYQRCGEDISASNGGAWFHAACHENANQDLTAHLYDNGADQGLPRDVHGGWHDAGDYGKYVPWTHATMWYLLHSVEWYPLGYTDNTNIPESGNGVPDMLDEAKWELDWFLRMQRSSDGALYSMVNQIAYSTTGDPSTDLTRRYYANVTTSATATGAMAFALGARIFKAYNAEYPGYSAAVSAAAVSAWNYLAANPVPVNCNPTGLYANDNEPASWDAQARVGAAAELFALTGSATYQNYFDANYNSAAVAGPVANPPTANDMFDPSLAEPLELGMISYCLAPGATSAVTAAIANALKNECEWNILPNNPGNGTAGDPYMSFMWDGHYTWGSNQLKASWGNQLLFAAKINADPAHTTAYVNQAEEYLHYFHGRNPLNWVYLTNMGTKGANLGASNSIMSIYHSWFFAGSTYDGNTGAGALGPAPGILSGGPDKDYAPDASYVGTISPPQNEPPMKSYKDWGAAYPEDSWEVTEPDQGYQAKYQFLLSAFAVSSAPTATPTATPTGTPPTATFTITPTSTSTSTVTPTPTATTCVQLLNGAETINENGTWSGTNATRSVSTTDATQLTHSLQAAVTNNPVGGWNDQVYLLGGFTPTDFSNVLQLKLDINVPAGIVGATYSQLFLSADSAPTTYEQPLASNHVDLVAGQNNNVTFNISLTGAFNPASPITKLYFIYNSDAATGPGTYGSFYLDNIRLITNCAVTPTFTPSHTLTPTFTPTSSFSPTFSPTPSWTPAATDTSSWTPTPTDSMTASPTDSLTATPSNTPLDTATPTFTSTNTFSPTPPATPTSTWTGTLSPLMTPTATTTPTFTSTFTSTFPGTFTFTNTPTVSLTATPSPTATPTLSPTAMPTSTFTHTATATPTTVTVQVADGPSSPGASSVPPGAADVPVLQFQLTNPGPSPAAFTTLTLTASGSGNDATGIASVNLYLDNNGDGVVDAGDTLLATSTYGTDNGTASLTIADSVAPGATSTYLVAYTFSGSALAGTYQTGFTPSIGLAGTNANGPISFNGPVENSAVATVLGFTPTFSSTAPNTSTATLTKTPTNSSTPTLTITPTATPTETMGPSTVTVTSTPGSKPVLYPNPADGSVPVRLRLSLLAPSDVKVQIFTTAFRKVSDHFHGQVPVGMDVAVDLKDDWGTPLASGIYYVVVTTSQGRSIEKLLILR